MNLVLLAETRAPAAAEKQSNLRSIASICYGRRAKVAMSSP